MNTEAVIAYGSLALAFPVAAYSAGCLWAAIRDLRRTRANREVRRLTTLPAPVEHIGATEAYGDELRQTRDDIPSVDLRTTAEQMAVDHAALDGIGDATDRMGEAIMHELRIFLRDMPDVLLEIMARYSGGHEDTPTSEWDISEVLALLAADELAGVAS